MCTAAAEQGITKLLTQRHNTQDFFTRNSDSIRQTIESTTQTMTLLIASIAVISLVVGVALQRAEGIGFGLFAAVVTLIMIPVVLLTWRSTATSIVLTKTGASALHLGRVLHHVDWTDLQRIERQMEPVQVQVVPQGERDASPPRADDARILSAPEKAMVHDDCVCSGFSRCLQQCKAGSDASDDVADSLPPLHLQSIWAVIPKTVNIKFSGKKIRQIITQHGLIVHHSSFVFV